MVKLGTPAEVPPQTDGESSWGHRTEMRGLTVGDNLNASYAPGEIGEQMVNDFRRVLRELDAYRRELRRKLAKIEATDG